MSKWLRARSSVIALAAIIAASVSLSIYWVFRVPIYESPDEPAHLDYALNIYSAGRPITVREPLGAWNSPPLDLHVFTEHLWRDSGVGPIAFHPSVKAPTDYGTRAFYDRLDFNTPGEDSGGLASKPRTGFSYITVYPAGYYTLLAGWIKLLRLFSKRITVLFFGARMLSVVLLGVSLVLIYATTRELHFAPRRALVLTAVVGLFPMTTFVSSYIQPDNLSLVLVMLCWYLALRFRRSPDDARLLLLLGIALGLLFFTKYHFYSVIFIAVFPMAIADQLAGRRKKIGWLRMIGLMLVPTLILLCVQAWIGYGSDKYPVVSDPSTQHQEFSQAFSAGNGAVVNFLAKGAAQAFGNFYVNGTTFQSFWGNFGWLDTLLVIVNAGTTEIIRKFIALLDVVVFALVLFRFEQVATRLIVIARRGRWRRALCIALSNPLLNSYFVFTILMFGLFMVVRMSFAPQGRNWFPFILPIFMTGTSYAPKALSHRTTRRAFAFFILACLVLYCVVGSCYAIRSINERYYGTAAVLKVPS